MELQVLTTGIDIYCSKVFSKESIAEILNKRFPEFDFELLAIDAEFNAEDTHTPNKGVYILEEMDESKFSFCISIFLAKETQPQEHFLLVAQDIAFLTKAESICGYVNPEDPENPYYSILFKADGSSYLVDDTAWEENQSFEVLEPLNFKKSR